MLLSLGAVLLTASCVLLVSTFKRQRRKGELELYSISADELYARMSSSQKVLLFDVRQPLDLLGHSEIIAGATRIPPRDLLANPALIPKDQDSVVYCTCPDDKTSRAVLHRSQSLHFARMKFLKGGLAAWKAKGYPVERYDAPFQLDTRS